MVSNKERIEALEVGLGGIQEGIQRLEEIVNKLFEALLPTKEAFSNNNNGREGSFRSHREENNDDR